MANRRNEYLTFCRVQLLVDCQHGKKGELLLLLYEIGEHLITEGKAAEVDDKSMTMRAGIEISGLSGGLTRKQTRH